MKDEDEKGVVLADTTGGIQKFQDKEARLNIFFREISKKILKQCKSTIKTPLFF